SLHRPMTGQHLVLCDGPEGDPGALRAVYARHLAGCFRQFLALGPELPVGVAHARLADLVRGAVAIDEGRLLGCFGSPTVGTPLRGLRGRDDLPAVPCLIDEAGAAMMPHLLFEMWMRGLIGDADPFL